MVSIEESRSICEIIREMEESETLCPKQKKRLVFEMIHELENIRTMERMVELKILSEKEQNILEKKISEFPSQDEIEQMYQMLLS